MPCLPRSKEAASRVPDPTRKRHENHGDSGSPRIGAGWSRGMRPVTTKFLVRVGRVPVMARNSIRTAREVREQLAGH